jgi:hypothetical protein
MRNGWAGDDVFMVGAHYNPGWALDNPVRRNGRMVMYCPSNIGLDSGFIVSS